VKTPEGMLMSITDTRYPQSDGDNPKAMMSMMITGNIKESPKLAVKFTTPRGETKVISFKIPVLVNKFIDKVDMEQDRFDHLWNDITKNRPNTFEKLDIILKNPVSSTGVDHMSVLKKLANIFNS
jgi:hypothetical protein